MTDVEALIDGLTLEEKAFSLRGKTFSPRRPSSAWASPRSSLTDGPSGARGKGLPGAGGPPSTCIPCGSAIGATWNPELARSLGALVGREALDRGCRGLLAPTVNLHRSPLAGRNFECYSEDPLLSGRLAAGYVRGVQSEGVFATVKHFVGNEAEFERGSINSVIDERALRELYLLPFEIAIREGGALAIMTAYNRVNGRWLTQQPAFLLDLLRDEWGFEGLVMTDWFAVAETTMSLGAGVDLEMPGPGRALGPAVLDAMGDGSLAEADVDAAVYRFLNGLDRMGVLDIPEPVPDIKPPSDTDVALLRRASAESMVLLQNDGTLPLQVGSLARIAVLGSHAVSPSIMGGGSAQVTPHSLATPLQALSDACGSGTQITVRARLRNLAGHRRSSAEPYSGPQTGFAATSMPVPISRDQAWSSCNWTPSGCCAIGGFEAEPATRAWSMRVVGTVIPEESGRLQLALAQAGHARLIIDGAVVLDGFANPAPPGGSEFFGQASQDLLADVTFERGVATEFVVEFASVNAHLGGFRLGFRTPDTDALLERATTVAAGADVAIVFVGTTQDTESEGHDREDIGLPGRQAGIDSARCRRKRPRNCRCQRGGTGRHVLGQ